MMTDTAFERWSLNSGLSSQAIEFISTVRASAPARLVAATHVSSPTRYCSYKMGWAMGTESRTIELPFARAADDDDNIVEIWDQPTRAHLVYRSPKGRKMGPVPTTFDFLTLERDGATLWDCKDEGALEELGAHNPNHYRLMDDGRWHNLPGEDWATIRGLRCHVFSSADIDWVYQRNLIWLDAYLRAGIPPTLDDAVESTRSLLADPFGLPLSELIERARATTDEINWMIAARRIFVDLRLAPLAEPERVRVFRDEALSRAYALVNALPPSPEDGTHALRARAGEPIMLDDTPWTIASATEATVTLLKGDGALDMARDDFDRFVARGRIRGIPEASLSESEARARVMLASAEPEDIDEALRRVRIAQADPPGGVAPPDPIGRDVARSRQRYAKLWREEGIPTYGRRYAWVALLPRHRNCGFYGPKLQPGVEDLMAEHIRPFRSHGGVRPYERPDGGTRKSVYGALRAACLTKGLEIPTYVTFCERIRRRDPHEQESNRRGPRAAYGSEPFYLELELTTPRHGDRAWETGHIDHSPGDVELFCPKTGKNLGTCWFTFLMDACTRRILAIYIAFHPPSYVSCMMVVRECVRRWGRLPETVVVDGAPEFRSVYFDRLLARYGVHKRTRPKANPRHGSTCERVFGTTMTQLLHSLQGNTEVRRHTRQVTKGVDPKRNGCWTLLALYLTLYAWADLVYDRAEHVGILETPADAYARSMQVGGEREHMCIPYDEDFIRSTLPSTPKGTARLQGSNGIKVNNLYYWCDAFRSPMMRVRGRLKKSGARVQFRSPEGRGRGGDVRVLYDPLDAGHVYAYVAGVWHECHAWRYYAVLKGRSVREVASATAELRRRHALQNGRQTFEATVDRIAAFLSEIKGVEDELVQLRNAEDRSVFSVIIGGLAALGATADTPPLIAPKAAQIEIVAAGDDLDDGRDGDEEEDDGHDDDDERMPAGRHAPTRGLSPSSTPSPARAGDGVEDDDDVCEDYA